jgi:hypothetical protein
MSIQNKANYQLQSSIISQNDRLVIDQLYNNTLKDIIAENSILINQNNIQSPSKDELLFLENRIEKEINKHSSSINTSKYNKTLKFLQKYSS